MLLSRKLPVAAIVLTITSIVAASAAGIIVGSRSLEKASFQSLSAVAEGRRNQVQTYLERIASDLEITAGREDVADAVTSFTDAWQFIEGDATKTLQDRYITNNPHPTGKKQLLDDGEHDGYDAVHRMYHAGLRALQERNGYYDVFLINPKGDVVYTVFKELDYATNLDTGKWSKTDLANIYRDVIKGGDPSKVYFRDFRGYGPSNDAPASFIAKAVVQRGEIVGVLVYQMPIDAITKILHNRTGLGQTGETLLMNKNGVLLVDSKVKNGGTALKTQIKSELLGQSTTKQIATGDLTGYRGMTSAAAAVHVDFFGVDWVVASLIDRNEAMAGVAMMTNWILGVGVALFFGALLVSTWFARSIARPIDRIVARMKQLASGDTTFDLSKEIGEDEIGQIAQSLDIFRESAIEKSRLEKESERSRNAREAEKIEESRQAQETMSTLGNGLGRLAQGDMNCQIAEPFVSHFDQLRLDFNEAVGKLHETMQSVQASTHAMASGTKEIASASQELASQTEINAANLEQTSSALFGIMATVKKTAEGAQQTQTAVSSAKSDAESGGAVALKAVDAMGRIEKSSSEISQIIGVIDEIAFQTNLLALNAGVEAARAGDAGRGFAVVASEVRALAQRSADAAKTITDLISTSSKEVGEGVQLVGQTGQALDRIVAKVSEIDQVVATIASDAREQADGVEGINQSISQMDQSTQKNAAMAGETTSACRSLSEESDRLEQVMAQFLVENAGSDRIRTELLQVAPHVFTPPQPAPKRFPGPAVTAADSGAPQRKVVGSNVTQDWDEF
ncbi:MAG: methyl-accepting chemotaxis protein [Hyphomicrobiaceae bacterium]